MRVKTAKKTSDLNRGEYELYDGEDYERCWIVSVDGPLPKEYKLPVPEIKGLDLKQELQKRKGK